MSAGHGGAGPASGRRIAVFLDMDHTLIDGNSAFLYMKFLRSQGRVSFVDMLQSVWWLTQYKLNVIDMPSVSRRAFARMAGDSEADLLAQNEAWFEEYVRPLVFSEVQNLLADHRRHGHVPVIVTASTAYASAPLARFLGIEHVICTRLEVENGTFTGRYVDPFCYGAGKIHWVEEFCERERIDRAASWFYTDSYTDLPLLEEVRHPVVVNPDPRLALAARLRRWPVLRFKRGKARAPFASSAKSR